MESVIIRNPRTQISSQNQKFVDRISTLPDDLISCILSSMPTKFAVQTSILSNRWRYLWTTITNLDFERPGYSDGYQKLASFADFISRVMLLCKSSQIQLFRLRCSGPWSFTQSVDKWIDEAIRLNASQIVVDVTYNHSLPVSLFTCKTLTTLKLKEFASRTPSSLYLPNLKILKLISSVHEELLQKFIYGCPILEDLYFYGEIFDKQKFLLYVTTPTMKRLEFRPYTVYEGSEIFINTPNLEYLGITTNLKVHLENLQSLVEASVHLAINHHPEDELLDWSLDWKSLSDHFIELLRRINGVKSLKLDFDDTAEEWDVLWFLDGAKLPKFHYLTSWEMVFSYYDSLKLLPPFLEISPNLESLSLEKFDWHDDSMVELQSISSFSLLHLEEVQLRVAGFERCENDLAVVEYLLRNIKVLKRMEINCVDDDLMSEEGREFLFKEQERKFYNELLKLREATGNCKIEFYGHYFQVPYLQGNGVLTNHKKLMLAPGPYML